MQIVVTGALGTLGRPLVRELRSRGHEVWGIDLTHDTDPEYARADITNWGQLSVAFAQAEPDTVYHLAAEFGRLNGELYTEQLWSTAMIGTRNVLDLCERHGADLIFASSSEVYGERDEEWLAEDMLPPKVFPNEYALSKWAGEQQIRTFQQRNPGFLATILRFFNAYGPGESPNAYRSVVAQFCDKALRGESLPVYQGYERTFMYIEDFIPTVATVCEADLNWNTYNIGGTDFRSVEDLAHVIHEEVAHHFGYLPEPVELIPEDTHNVRSKRPEIWRAEEDLGHNPTVTLEDGIPATLEWMQSTRAETKLPASS